MPKQRTRRWNDADFPTRAGRLGAERLDVLRDSAGFQDSVTAGLRAAREKFIGERNVMAREEVRAKIRGDQNPMKRDDVKAKHLEAVRAYHARKKAQRDA
jgi:hypothetical protein